jgi:hypothetical protein
MQMRGEAGNEFVCGPPGMVDVVDRVLLRRCQACIEVRFWVVGPQSWPPVALKTLLEGPAVERTEGVTAHAARVLGHEGERRLEPDVRPGKQMSRQPGIGEQRGAVLAVVRGQQADAVHVVKIGRLTGADTDRFALHRAQF